VSNLRQLFSVVTPEKAVLPLQQSVEPSTSAKRMEIYLAFAQNKRLIDSQADHSPLVQWAKRVSDGNKVHSIYKSVPRFVPNAFRETLFFLSSPVAGNPTPSDLAKLLD